MSVAGFDVGNESGVVAVARQRGIDVVLNDESKRETPAIVCFSEKQRFLGTAGAASSMMNPKNTISQIKRFIGRKFSDPELQKDIKSLPFSVTEGPDGYPLIHAQYEGENRTFTPTQLLGMVLSDLKIIAEKNLNSAVVDCCIGIPVYFTDLQRRAVIDAATIAGLNPLHLIHETTATALAYGIYKTDLPVNEPINVAFVDVGHASMQVCVVAFKKGQLKILAHSYDQCLGGRDFDELLFQHFAAKFKDEYKIDVYQNARACLKLRAACEKLKKVLSENAEASLNIECLMDDMDVIGFIKRDDFEQISSPILERVRKPLERALVGAGLTTQDIHSVEVVGSGSRVPMIINILTEFFGKEPRRTMNASQCVAEGSALQCSILSPAFKVQDFQNTEARLEGLAMEMEDQAARTSAIEAKFDNLAAIQKLQFDLVSEQIAALSGRICLKESTSCTAAEESTTLAHQRTIDLPTFNGSNTLAWLASADHYFLVHKTPMEKRVELALIALSGPAMSWIQLLLRRNPDLMWDQFTHELLVRFGSDPTIDGYESLRTTSQEGSLDDYIAEFEGRLAQLPELTEKQYLGFFLGGLKPQNRMQIRDPTTITTYTAALQMAKHIDFVFERIWDEEFNRRKVADRAEIIHGGLAATDVQKAVKKQFEMTLQDGVMEETKDRKNAVQAYIYDMRNKLHGIYYEFVTESDRNQLISIHQEVEDWLYEDGEDQTKGVYIAKLDELKKQGDPIEERFKEHSMRVSVIDQFIYCINSYKEAAFSIDSKFDHIELAQKQKVLNECVEAEAWLREKQRRQDTLPKYMPPVLLSADVKKKAESLDRFCRPIMTKPKPTAQPSTPKPSSAFWR